MNNVTRTEQAERDLKAIWRYVADFDEVAADCLLRKLDQRAAQLKLFPHMGRPRPDLGQELRSLISSPYLIIYRLERDQVQILRYVHMSRQAKGLV